MKDGKLYAGTEQYVFGVDLGGTTIKHGLFTVEGQLIDKWEIPTRTENAGEQILPDIAASIKEAMTRHGVSLEQVKGIGLGVPGAVTKDRYAAPCVNLNGWGGDVAGELSAMTGCAVRAVNDANAAALGEMWQGGAKGYENVVFVTLGTGVGGGIIVGGRLVSGVHGAGGEIGHIKVNDKETEPCGCGKRGCLEQYASATGIVREAKRRLAVDNTPTELRKFEDLTAKDIFDCAKGGEETALSIVDFFAKNLGKALANISCVCDPEVFVIGGGVSAAGQIILGNVENAYRQNAFPASEEAKFVLASLGNDAGICGCARLMLDSL